MWLYNLYILYMTIFECFFLKTLVERAQDFVRVEIFLYKFQQPTAPLGGEF